MEACLNKCNVYFYHYGQLSSMISCFFFTKRHETKLIHLRRHNIKVPSELPQLTSKTLLNFSLYQLFNDELTALSYGLDHHIPSKVNRNRIYTDFNNSTNHF